MIEPSFLAHLVHEAEERSAKYREYRDYYDGNHSVRLSDRQMAYLTFGAETDHNFSANYMHIVVDSLAQRLTVKNFDAGPLTDTLNEWWRRARMDSRQFGLVTSCIRDGDCYLLVGWDNERGIPTFHVNTAYDGRDGAHVFYSTDDDSAVAATKRWWVEYGQGAGDMRRMNVYFPDRVERYYSHSRQSEYGWLPFSSDGLPTILDFTDDANDPLGIPLIHFTNRSRGFHYGLSEIEPGIPMQRALNKSIIDLLAAADASGFRIWVMLGDEPSADLAVSPGGFVYSPRSPDEVSITAVPGEPMRPLIEVVDSFVQRIGQVTDTPLSYFQLSGQMASEGTHKAHEARMLAKARVTATEIGNSWEDAMRMAIKLSNVYGGTNLDPDTEIIVNWEDFDIREEIEKLVEKSGALGDLVSAGSGIKNAALVAKFTNTEAEMLAEVDYNAVLVEQEMMRRMAISEKESQDGDPAAPSSSVA